MLSLECQHLNIDFFILTTAEAAIRKDQRRTSVSSKGSEKPGRNVVLMHIQ